MNAVDFTFSDSVAGYVASYDKGTDRFILTTSDGREFAVQFKNNTYGWIANNLSEPRQWCDINQMRSMVVPGRYLFVYGIYYPEGGGYTYEAQFLVFVGRTEDHYVFERPDWWVQQIVPLGDFYLKAQFGIGPIDYRNYRTTITLTGEKEADNYRQETDTISRLVYGLASCYLLSGEDRFLEGAEKGVEYLREHMRFYDADERVVYWYHGIDVHFKLMYMMLML